VILTAKSRYIYAHYAVINLAIHRKITLALSTCPEHDQEVVARTGDGAVKYQRGKKPGRLAPFEFK